MFVDARRSGKWLLVPLAIHPDELGGAGVRALDVNKGAVLRDVEIRGARAVGHDPLENRHGVGRHLEPLAIENHGTKSSTDTVDDVPCYR